MDTLWHCGTSTAVMIASAADGASKFESLLVVESDVFELPVVRVSWLIRRRCDHTMELVSLGTIIVLLLFP